ncbi:hypothetical protein J4E91_005833 [Alternaria rosae]|nr:hypothetical protein J4E91_005833 [Alternaria rosae]
MPAKLHNLGKNGPKVPAVGFGLMGMSYIPYGSVPSDEERFALLDRAVELGTTFWDTSDLYGDNEVLLNKWFKRTGKRSQIFLATKFGFVKNSPAYDIDSSPEYAQVACAESLETLGTDYIDLYYVHNANPSTPIEATMRALRNLKEQGKIRHIGLSSISSTTLRRAVAIAPVAAVQVDYSVFQRDIEGPTGSDILATCRELGVAIVAATPLGRGMITSTFAQGEMLGDGKDMRPAVMPRFQEANREANEKVVVQFQALADKQKCSVSQLALAWLLKQGDDIIPIPGTKRINYLEQNLASMDIELSDEDEKEIRAFAYDAAVKGTAQPAQFSGYLYRDTVEE